MQWSSDVTLWLLPEVVVSAEQGEGGYSTGRAELALCQMSSSVLMLFRWWTRITRQMRLLNKINSCQESSSRHSAAASWWSSETAGRFTWKAFSVLYFAHCCTFSWSWLVFDYSNPSKSSAWDERSILNSDFQIKALWSRRYFRFLIFTLVENRLWKQV